MIVLAVIFFIFFVLLIIPLGVSVGYNNGEYSLAARVFLFDFVILSSEEKTPKREKKKKPKKEKKEEAEKEDDTKKPKLSFSFDEIMDLIRLGLNTLSNFRRKLTVNWFKLHFISASEDPYSASMMFGYVNSALQLLSGYNGRAFNARKADIKTAIDFQSTDMSIDVEMTITTNIGKLLAVLISAGFGFLKIKRKSKKQLNNPETENERKENNGINAEKLNV